MTKFDEFLEKIGLLEIDYIPLKYRVIWIERVAGFWTECKGELTNRDNAIVQVGEKRRAGHPANLEDQNGYIVKGV